MITVQTKFYTKFELQFLYDYFKIMNYDLHNDCLCSCDCDKCQGKHVCHDVSRVFNYLAALLKDD